MSTETHTTIASLDYRNPEVVLGVVAPVGTDLTQLRGTLGQHLKRFRYRFNPIKLSEFLTLPGIEQAHGVEVRTDSEFHRVSTLMDAGNAIRRVSEKRDFMALLAASRLSQARHLQPDAPLFSTVHLLDSLKRPRKLPRSVEFTALGFF